MENKVKTLTQTAELRVKVKRGLRSFEFIQFCLTKIFQQLNSL